MPDPNEDTYVYGEKPRDTERHDSTRIRGKKHETTVFEFGKSKLVIYRGNNGIEWALMNLAGETNKAIGKKEVEGQLIEIGDIVQACVVRYVINNRTYHSKTQDAPEYTTLPYEIIKAPEGYLLSRLAVPEEFLFQFKIPVTVGDLIPILTEEEKNKVFVTLQLKEATKISKQEELEEFLGKQTGTKYTLSEEVNSEAKEFADFIDGRQDKEEFKEFQKLITRDNTKEIEKVVKKELKKRASETDTENFGFKP